MLNSMTVRDSYLMPPIDEYINYLENAAVSSTVDSSDSIWQIEIEDVDEKNAFKLHQSFYHYNQKAFWTQKYPLHISSYYERDLVKRELASCIFFFDNILVLIRTHKQHIYLVRNNFWLFLSARATLFFKESKLCAGTID